MTSMSDQCADSPDTDTCGAVSFLRNWVADTVQLTAIYIDQQTHQRGRIETQAFDRDADLDDGGAVERWIAERQGNANLYFSPNTLLRQTQQ